MDPLERRDSCEIIEVQVPEERLEFYRTSGNAVRLVAEPYRNAGPVLQQDAGDFAKWLMSGYPGVRLEMPEADKLVLHSSDVWLPLAMLASEMGLPVYLNIVSNYLYDRMRGALRRERPRVHLSVEYLDVQSGSFKCLKFEGDHESLKGLIKKIDVNELMDGG